MSSTTIEGTTALVTGANRGIGRAITQALLERGAAKVYATARDPRKLDDLVERYGDRIEAVELDVTDADRVAAVASQASDVEVVVNNAGIALAQELTAHGVLDQARQEMEVNYFAVLRLIGEFAPALARNGGGALINVSSIGGLTNFPLFPTYSASKAANHSLTQGARMLLAGQGTSVFGVYPGPVDTDMAAGIEMDKTSPADVAGAILDAVEADREDVFPDPFSVGFGEQYQASPKESERQITAMLSAPVGA